MVTNKGYIAAVAFLISTIILGSSTAYYYVQYEQYSNAYNNLIGDNIFVNLGVNYNNGTILWYNNTLVPENITAFDLTLLVCSNVTYDMYPFGVFITGINGINASEYNSWWQLFYNNVPSLVGANDLYLLSGDTIIWFLTPL